MADDNEKLSENSQNVTSMTLNATLKKIDKSEEVGNVASECSTESSKDVFDGERKLKREDDEFEIENGEDNTQMEYDNQNDKESNGNGTSVGENENINAYLNERIVNDKDEGCSGNIVPRVSENSKSGPSSDDLNEEKGIFSIAKDPAIEPDEDMSYTSEDSDEEIYTIMYPAQRKTNFIYDEVDGRNLGTFKPGLPVVPPPLPTEPRPTALLQEHIYDEANEEESNFSSEDTDSLHLPKLSRPRNDSTLPETTDEILQPLHIIDPLKSINMYKANESEGLRKIILDQVPQDISIKELFISVERDLLSKGDELEDITFNRSLREAVITLNAAAVAKKLVEQVKAEKSFVLRQSLVSVEHYQDKGVDPAKVLLIGLNENSTIQVVANKIEEKCGIQPSSVIIGDDPTTALLVFDTIPDMTELQHKLKRENTKWETLPVERTRRICVRGIPKETAANDLEHYLNHLSNHKSVNSIKYRMEWNDYIITFSNVEDADEVVKAGSYNVKDVELEVSLYYPFLAGDEEYFVNIPAPLKMDTVNSYICRFLQESRQSKKDVVEIVEKHNGKIIWPGSKMERALYIQCNVDERDRTAIAKVKTWKETIPGIVSEICKMFSVKIRYFALEIKSQVRSKIEGAGSAEPDSFYIRIEENRVVIAGDNNSVDKWDAWIKNMIESLELEYESQGKCLTQKMKLKTYELTLLNVSNGFEQLANVEKKLEKNILLFKGRKKTVDRAIVRVKSMLRDFPKQDIRDMNILEQSLLRTKRTSKYVQQKIRHSGITGIWRFSEHGILELYSTSHNELKMAEKCLRSCFKTSQIQIELRLRENFGKEKFLEKLEAEYTGAFRCELSSHVLCIVSLDCLHDEIVEKVRKFVDLQKIVTEDFLLDPGEFRFIFSYKKKSIANFVERYKDLNVEVNVFDKLTRKGFTVKGKRNSCKTAIADLRAFVTDTVCRNDQAMNSLQLSKYYRTSAGINELKRIELSEKCVIRISTPNSNVVPTKLTLAECRIGNCELQILQGDITEAVVDFLVNPNDLTFDQKYGLARTLVDKGGFSIQKDCQDNMSRTKCVKEGDTFISSSGHLPCRGIIQVVLPIWTKERNDKETMISQAVTNCLCEAEGKRASSIAFPPLGAGRFRYPSDAIAENMIRTVKKYLIENGADTYLRHIYIFDVEKDFLLFLVKAMQKEMPHSIILIPEILTEGKPEPNDPLGCLKLYPEIAFGCLLSQDVDVIVNSTNSDLNLRIGGLSKAIIEDGGEDIESELKKKYPNGILLGEIAESNAGKLRCKAIFHGVLVNWDDGEGHAEMVMNNFIQRCLSTAVERQYKSIAFPVLAKGTHLFPPSCAAKVMIKAIGEFAEENTVPSLETIRIIIQPDDEKAIKAFEEYKSPAGLSQTVSQLSIIHRKQRCKPESVFIENNGKYFTTKIGHVTISIEQGDIAEADTAIIVNSVPNSLNLDSGRISRSILRASGKSIQFEANEYRENFKRDDLVTTSSGSLKSQKIIHVRARNGFDGWKQTFIKSLAEVERLQLSSVSFPALGTGGKGFPANEMARTMISAFQKYIRGDHYRGCLKVIKIVIYDAEMVDIFIKEAKAALKAAQRMSFFSKFWESKSSNNTDCSSMVFHIYTDTADVAKNVKRKISKLCHEISRT